MAGGREIVFDTETTGFKARDGDRITEIGCIEIMDLLPTGKSFHAYCDPEGRELPPRVVEITGLTNDFLRGKPKFKDHAQGFLDFIGDSPLIAHNSDFDKSFINEELFNAGFDILPNSRFIDTLIMARKAFPGANNTLDGLCKRFDISLSSRDTHGAIIDSELLAKVYLELNGGRARSFDLDTAKPAEITRTHKAPKRPIPLAPLSTQAERETHKDFVKTALGEKSYWQRHWTKIGES